MSILAGVLMDRAEGSVAIATLFHGAVNLLGFTNTASNATLRGRAIAVSYLLVARVVGRMVWSASRNRVVASTGADGV